MEELGEEEEEEVDYGHDEGDAPASAEKAIEVGTGEEIYGDLYDDEGEKDVLLKAKHAALQEQCRDQEATINKLREKVESLKAEKDGYQEERRILIRNISCLFRTAQEEMTRRDELMQSKEQANRSLRTQLAAEKRMHVGEPTSPPPLPPPQEHSENWQAAPH